MRDRRAWLRLLLTLLVPAVIAYPLVLLVRRVIPAVVVALGVRQGAGYLAAGLTELATAGLGVAALWLFYRISGYDSLAGLGLQARKLWGLPAGLMLALTLVGITLGLLSSSGMIAAFGVRSLSLGVVVYAVGTATRAAFIEEIACRGIVLQGVERLWSRIAGILASTVVFVLPHAFSQIFPMTGPRWIMLVVAGVMWALAYYVTGRNLWFPIGLHLGFDLWIFLSMGIVGRTPGFLVVSGVRLDLNWAFLFVQMLFGLILFASWRFWEHMRSRT